MSFQQLVFSYLALGLLWGIIDARSYGHLLLDILKGKTVTIYGTDTVHVKKRADDLLESVKDIRKIQEMVSDKIMAFLFALVMTAYCIWATISFPYQIYMGVVSKHKMQVKEAR